MQLITYADRLGGDLRGLHSILRDQFDGLFNGVHILPFFDPIDGADAGFDPVDHTQVDSRLGDWNDIAAIAGDYSVMADLIVNHMSSDSKQFRDVQKNGRKSPHWDLFLRKGDVFPEKASDTRVAEEIGRIYRPRPGAPFTSLALDEGSQVEFWTTFSDKQLDINVEIPAGQAYLDSILEKFAAGGVREIRLDAAGYAIKRRGTACFMLPETFDFIAELSERAEQLGIATLVEIHSHYQTQVAIAASVDRVYDFALPPLVLHSLYTGDFDALQRWLSVAPRNCVTVLDTHDGIGILDVARQGDIEGLLADDEVDNLVNTIHERTGGDSRRASGHAASNLDIYQVNSTYYDALGQNDVEYLIARAIQFFAPGTPQVYYVGLLAGENDVERVASTGVGRDINRHHYSKEEISAAIRRPVVGRLMELMRLRNQLAAFSGAFSIDSSPRNELTLRWDNADAFAKLHVDLGQSRATITYKDADGNGRFDIDAASLQQQSGAA